MVYRRYVCKELAGGCDNKERLSSGHAQAAALCIHGRDSMKLQAWMCMYELACEATEAELHQNNT